MINRATVFRRKFCQIPRTSSQNFAARHGTVDQIVRLTAAFQLCVK